MTRIDQETESRANGAIDFINSAGGQLGIPPSALANIKPFAYRSEYSTAVIVTQPLYNGGAELVGVSAANAQDDRSRFSYQDTEQEVVARVRLAYYNVLKAEGLVNLAAESAVRTKRYLEMTKRRADVGMRTTTDVLRWEVQLASDEGGVISAENGRAAARLALNEVLGVELERAFTLERLASVDSLLASDQPLQGGSALAVLGGPQEFQGPDPAFLASHPAMLSVEASVRLAEVGIDNAWVNFKPRLNLGFQYGWEKNGSFALDGYRPWAVSLQFTWPVFNGFGDYANVQRARAEYQRAETQAESFRRVLHMQATNAQLTVRAARKRIDIAKKAAREATDVLNSVSRRYEQGGASNVDLIDVQTAYSSARTNLITALYDYYAAGVLFERATGTVSLASLNQTTGQ